MEGARRVERGAPGTVVSGAARRILPWLEQRLRSERRRTRAAAAGLLRAWRRSLQLRVVGTTMVISVLVVAVLGVFLIRQIANGLLQTAQRSAITQTSNGLAYAQEPGSNQAPRSVSELITLARTLQAGSGPGDEYYVVILQQDPISSLHGVASNQALARIIPPLLHKAVGGEQRQGRSDHFYYAPTLMPGKRHVPALAVGVPISSNSELYYVFPLTQQQQALSLVQTAVISTGIALVLLLAVVVSLVTRWVVLPIRQAAQAATRLSDGRLDERMPVRGTDDLSALADSFNGMAESLQEKLRELEELSKAQRQFVSDVSHELRTPLTTIRIAADVLLGAKDQLTPAAGRSAELLQGQLERFEALLVDLLEISRYDSNVATLDAESADVCDLVRRAAADAEQLAARRGTRIVFRFPPGPCIAEVDRRRVERVLRNLLDNAVEHGEGRDVVVTVAGDRDAVAVAVRDHGVGFRPGEEQLVFERFWRADPARARTTGGTGLGLAIALEDTRLHGGWLQAWGRRGVGSVFRLTLPRVARGELAGSPLPLGPDEGELGVIGDGAPADGQGGMSVAVAVDGGGPVPGPPGRPPAAGEAGAHG